MNAKQNEKIELFVHTSLLSFEQVGEMLDWDNVFRKNIYIGFLYFVILGAIHQLHFSEISFVKSVKID